MEDINYCWGYILLYLNFFGSFAIFLICLSILSNNREISPNWKLMEEKDIFNSFLSKLNDNQSEDKFEKSDIYYVMWLEFPVIFISFFFAFSYCVDEDECDCVCAGECEKTDGIFCKIDNGCCYVFFICICIYFGIALTIRAIYIMLTSCGKQLIRYVTITLMFILNLLSLIFIVLHISNNYFYPKITVILCFSSILALSNFFVLLFVNFYQCFGCYVKGCC